MSDFIVTASSLMHSGDKYAKAKLKFVDLDLSFID